jgi:hypothetical protein
MRRLEEEEEEGHERQGLCWAWWSIFQGASCAKQGPKNIASSYRCHVLNHVPTQRWLLKGRWGRALLVLIMREKMRLSRAR